LYRNTAVAVDASYVIRGVDAMRPPDTFFSNRDLWNEALTTNGLPRARYNELHKVTSHVEKSRAAQLEQPAALTFANCLADALADCAADEVQLPSSIRAQANADAKLNKDALEWMVDVELRAFEFGHPMAAAEPRISTSVPRVPLNVRAHNDMLALGHAFETWGFKKASMHPMQSNRGHHGQAELDQTRPVPRMEAHRQRTHLLHVHAAR
jgi:hypothetical protein